MLDALTDADSVVRSTTTAASKTASVASYVLLTIFFTHNNDCKNENVCSVIGQCARFQSI